jgi:hypothetical protein
VVFLSARGVGPASGRVHKSRKTPPFLSQPTMESSRFPRIDDIRLKPEELELLRTMVLSRDPRPLDFFPIMLVQIVTKRHTHNLGPIVTEFSFRFYFEGLIIHMLHNLNWDFGSVEKHSVGFSQTLIVQTQMFENSFQFKNALRHIAESTLQWPEAVRTIIRS